MATRHLICQQEANCRKRDNVPDELRGRRCLDHHKRHHMCHCRGEHQNLLSWPALIHVGAEHTELPLRYSQRHKSPWDLQELHDVLAALLAQIQGVGLDLTLMLWPRKTLAFTGNEHWKENLLNRKLKNIAMKSTTGRLFTTESTNVIPAPADKSDSLKVYMM